MKRSTRRWNAFLLFFAFVPLNVQAQQKPEPSEAVDDARERKVMERFLAVLEKSPRRGTALDRVYGFHVEQGSIDAFVKNYQAKVAANPKDGMSWLLIGLIEAQRGRDASAVEAFRQAETCRPEDALPSYYLGQALVLVGQPDAATEAFERALTRKPARADLLDIYQALGRVHQRAHRDDKALAVWDRLEKAFPDDPRVQDQIAHALADEGQDAAALVRFEALVKSTKDQFRKVQFAIEAAELKVRLGKGPEALADFEGLLAKLDPESWLGREVRHKVEEVFLRTDDLAGLATYYESWIKKTPDDVEAMARLGRTLAGLGRLPEARKWLDQAVKLAPTRRELRLALIEQLVQDRDYAGAASQYEALAKLEPNNPDVIRDWGRLLIRDSSKPEEERKKAASAVWRKLAPDDAKDAVLVAQAADLFRQAGSSDEAIALYQRAIKLAPDSNQYREYLGEYYHALKRPVDALATWRAGVEGNARNARTLGRLGEVMAGFGYRIEALEPMTEACRLEPDDFDLRLKLAELKLELDRPLEAVVELEKAEKSALADEQREAVIDRLIRAHQASGTLAETIGSLRKSLASQPTASGWTRLARLLEADQKVNDAAKAITEATKLDPKSVAAWVATARLREAAGDLLGAAEAFRTLTKLDRRARTDYLTGIAKLEARLGRKRQALEAGRELLAVAPGNPDHHQFFAELCFQLGETEEGIDALRRASRANPSDPKAMLTLAENLARQFRGEEAIELYWRAFAKAPDIESKLTIVARMTDQYLQRNQLDRLLARLERELREPNQQRELALCLSQAHSASGDYSTARTELERLLSTNARDTSLLIQLSNLAEQEGDPAIAAKYQKQALEVAPNPEGNGRLAQLYLESGEMSEAEAIWSRLASASEDPSRILSALDRLIAHGKSETALSITERMLVKKPGDWQALYREAVALESLGKTADATRRFRAILELKLDDDASGASRPKSSRNLGNNPANPPQPVVKLTPNFPIQSRIVEVTAIRGASKLSDNPYAFTNGSIASLWSPADFGQARMASLAWLAATARRENQEDALIDSVRQVRDKAIADARSRWDWYYLQLVRDDGPETFAAARDLARTFPDDPSASYAFLLSLENRAKKPAQVVGRRNRRVRMIPQQNEKAPSLEAKDADLAIASFRNLRKRKPEVAPLMLLNVMISELKRARREADLDAIYRELVGSANEPSTVEAAISIAAERGKVDDFLALQSRSTKLAAKQPVGLYGMAVFDRANQYGEAMSQRAGAKSYGDVLRLLDHYLDTIRQPDAFVEQAQARSSASFVSPMNYQVKVGKTLRGVTLDYPQPNAYFDGDAIQVLRNAYELYKRDDLLSDLSAHLKTLAGQWPEGDKVYPVLALGYLSWWDDDKEGAIEILRRAIDLAKGDIDLRLGLAELQARRGEAAEALGLVEGVDPLDQKTMQRRELMALQLSVLSGNVERARKASERLFGLRLDTTTQMQLASQMSLLGMNELAETVLSRVRRKTGSNQSTLTALMLQYQQTGKTEQAFQIAGQILRSTANRPISPLTNGNNYKLNEEMAARNEAIAVFGRSGKMKELIERAEAQLAASPGSVQVLKMLIEYYQADNQEAKVKETLARLAKLRPDDLTLRYQIANQMFQAGDAAGSIEHYTACFKKEPIVYLNRYYEILNAFQQAGKMEDLGKLFEDLDLKLFSANPWGVQPVITSLNQDVKTRAIGQKLFRKFWKAFPDLRGYLILGFDAETLSRLPEIYDYLRDSVIPSAGKVKVAPWASLEVIQGWDNQGKIIGIVERLMEVLTKQNRLDDFAKDLDEALKRHPDWAGGLGLKAIVQIRRGKVADARKTLEELLTDEKEIPTIARLILGQELSNIRSLMDIEIKLYEEASEEDTKSLNFFQAPSGRLVSLFQRVGKENEAREMILKFAKKPRETDSDDENAAAYQRWIDRLNCAQQMIMIGYPADAIRFYEEVLADGASLEAVEQRNGNRAQIVLQMRMSIQQTILTVKEKDLGPTLLVLADAPAPFEVNRPAGSASTSVDLVLSVAAFEVNKYATISLFGELVDRASKMKNQEILAELKGTLDRKIEAHPTEPSPLIARCLVAIASGETSELARTSTQLVGWLDRSPLDPIEPDARPNARQRADATARLGVWLVARECLKQDATRANGEALQIQALEAARRQAENRWTLAIRREAGQSLFERGDRAGAERSWRKMLEEILAPPSSKKKAPKLSALPIDRGSMILLAVAPLLLPQNPVVPPPVPPNGFFDDSEATNFVKFQEASQVAELAAENGLHQLSADAIRAVLENGPPVVPIELDGNQTMQGVLGAPGSMPVDQATMQIEQRLLTLNSLWSARRMPPRLAYQTLRAIVLPDRRPGEVFLYARSLMFGNIEKPRSIGALLVQRAIEAGEVDDLRRRIEARKEQTLAVVPARVLEIQLALATKDEATTTRLLGELTERLKQLPLQGLSDLIGHAAIPALDLPAAEPLAIPLIELAMKAMGPATGDGQEVFGSLLLAIARRKFKANQPDEARAVLASYIDRMQSDAVRANPEYFLFYRKQILANVAAEYAKAGRAGDAWETLGRFADAPNSKQYQAMPDLGRSLPRVLQLARAMPATERYAMLRDWTLPTKERNSVRLLSAFVAEDPAIPSIFGPMPHAFLAGLADTTQLLFDSAREVAKLDEIVAEAAKAAEKKAENGETLYILARINAGRGSEVKEAILNRIDVLKKQDQTQPTNPNIGMQPLKPVEWSDFLIVHRGLFDRSLESTCTDLASLLLARSNHPQNFSMFPGRIKRDLVLCKAQAAGKLANPSGPDPGLAYWHPSSLQASSMHQMGTILPFWVESQGFISQITGPQSQFLLFDFPLTGKFEASADVFLGDGAEGQLAYGGLIYEPDNGGSVYPVGHQEARSATDHFANRGHFNRMTVQVEPGKQRVLLNGHLFHEEVVESATSPWFGFSSQSNSQSGFRNVTLKGSPEIPREVQLVQRDHLLGWACGFYNEGQPQRRILGQPDQVLGSEIAGLIYNNVFFDWQAKDGMIIGQRYDTLNNNQTTPQSRIYYHRPILDGESISYEFFYEPGRIMTHPSLERLVFLLEPEGVKLHWMTDPENDATGLESDNLADPGEFRRGSGPLPLRAGEWNKASVRYDGGLVKIDLNGSTIYEYPLEPANQRIFGFYHDKTKTMVKVREVVLRGNWPTSVPEDWLARRIKNEPIDDRRARGAMIDEKFTADAAGSILIEARRLAPEARFDRLAHHVLPDADHADFRVEGEFSPLPGNRVESPAIELVETAKTLGKLDELADRIDKEASTDQRNELSKKALGILVKLAKGDDGGVAPALIEVKGLVKATGLDSRSKTNWPAVLAASAGVNHPRFRERGLELFDLMDQQWRPDGLADWASVFRPIRTRAILGEKSSTSKPGWAVVTHGDAASRGRGLPDPVWTFESETWTHHPGHRYDHLYLTSPLRGNFTVECELSSFGWRETQLSYAAMAVAIETDRKSYQLRNLGQIESTNPIEPPLAEIGPWYAFKLVVADGMYSASVNGQKIHESRLSDEPDPWLSIASRAIAEGGVKNLKITGNPVIPTTLALTNGPTLSGWLADYYDDSYLWTKQGDEIVGGKIRDPNIQVYFNNMNDYRAFGPPGSKRESVLKYNRPMLEDGEIGYEFLYQPGKVMVHPALDRLTFLIEPDGVKIHSMTDAQHDRTGALADNVTTQPEHRRGPASPPLIANDWNRLKLRLEGDVVTLILNDVVIYERPLEPSNHRDLGLFHYADETEVRVRNVRYQGQWPTTLNLSR